MQHSILNLITSIPTIKDEKIYTSKIKSIGIVRDRIPIPKTKLETFKYPIEFEDGRKGFILSTEPFLGDRILDIPYKYRIERKGITQYGKLRIVENIKLIAPKWLPKADMRTGVECEYKSHPEKGYIFCTYNGIDFRLPIHHGKAQDFLNLFNINVRIGIKLINYNRKEKQFTYSRNGEQDVIYFSEVMGYADKNMKYIMNQFLKTLQKP